ncbi:MAG: amidohydrolase [Thermoplasmata archaeon]|nr:amidohydrolase [Thermoplasmata archaeon]
MSADGAFLEGRVFTGRDYVEAFLVENGRIVAIGTDADVRRQRPVGCPIHRLHGQLVIPGLVDPHIHLIEIVRARRGVPLGDVRSLGDLVGRLQCWGEEHPTGPIVGRGWDERQFAEGRAPTRRELDRVGTARAVVLYRVCGHAAVVNSVALDSVGAGTKPPTVLGGRFGEEQDGSPDGRIYERALELLQPIVNSAPPPSADDLRAVTEEAASMGLTMVGSVNAPLEELASVAELATGPTLPLRLRLYVRADQWRPGHALPKIRPNGESRSIVRGLKAITDGSFGARTAWLDEPYADDPSTSGLAVWPEARLRELARAAAEAKISLALHAIGDRALATVVRVFADESELPAPRVEHASLVPPSLLRAVASFRGTIVVQPHFAETDGWIPDRLGAERAQWAYAWRSLLTCGAKLAGSSDAPFDAFDPWSGMKSAVDGAAWRRAPGGRDPERLTPEEAVAMYTVGGARALDEHGPHGLAVDGPADFVVVRAKQLSSAVERLGRDGFTTWSRGVRVGERRPDWVVRAGRR